MNLRIWRQRGGFTLIEVVATIAAVLMVAVLLASALSINRRKTVLETCRSNMREIAVGFIIWAQDSENGHFPVHTPYQEGGLKNPGTNRIQIAGVGAFNPTLRSNAWLQFAFINKQLADPKKLCCPADRERKPATSWSGQANSLVVPGVQNNAISYCLNVDTKAKPEGDFTGAWTYLLLTERHMEYDAINTSCAANVGLSKAVRMKRSSNDTTRVGWKLQNPTIHKKVGNVALANGGAYGTTTAELQTSLEIPPYDNGELHFIYP